MSSSLKPNDLLWYFAYGSNMNDKVRKRRNVCPKQMISTRVPGWRLTYDLRGVPWLEPAFADIEPLDETDVETPVVQGVLMKITKSEFDGIVVTEGGGGVHKDGYHEIAIEAVPLQGDQTPIKAFTLSVGQNSSCKLNGALHLPSKRYLNLLIEGAKSHQLEESYVSWLESHCHHEPEHHIKNKALRYFCLFVIIAILIPVVILMMLNSKLYKVLPPKFFYPFSVFSHTIAQLVGKATWAYHDIMYFIFGIFGLICVRRGGNKGILLKEG